MKLVMIMNDKNEKNVPRATLQRYPLYLKALRKLQEDGTNRIMSRELAELVSIEPTTIRRDFSFIGNLGKQGYGYDVTRLIEIFSEELGVNFDEKIILVGAGNLGRALLNYNHWNHIVGTIVCAFDLEPSSEEIGGIPVCPFSDLNRYMPEGTRIAILTISQDVQETVDLLVDAGIEGFVSFAMDHFSVPSHVSVRHIDVVSKIQELVFETNEKQQNKGV